MSTKHNLLFFWFLYSWIIVGEYHYKYFVSDVNIAFCVLCFLQLHINTSRILLKYWSSIILLFSASYIFHHVLSETLDNKWEMKYPENSAFEGMEFVNLLIILRVSTPPFNVYSINWRFQTRVKCHGHISIETEGWINNINIFQAREFNGTMFLIVTIKWK